MFARAIVPAALVTFVCVSLPRTLAAQCEDRNCATYGVAVTPDNGAAPARPPNTGEYSAAFTIENTGSTGNTYSLSCSGSSNVSCHGLSTTSVWLAAGTNTVVTAYYDVKNPGSASVILTAVGNNASDQGSYAFTVTAPPAGAPLVDVTPYNYQQQDLARCAVTCFGVTYAQSTVPYFSLDAPRAVTLVFRGDRAPPKPFVHVNVSPDLSQSAPTEYRLQVKLNGAFVTFVNGEQVLRFAYPGNVLVRLGGQFDASGYATNVYPLEIHVSAIVSGLLKTHVVTTKIAIVNEATSPVARGWTLAGIQRLYVQGDQSLLLPEGEGSSVYFRKISGPTRYLAPAGEFSKIVSGTPSGGLGWTRSYADSTKVVFNSAGRMIEVRDRFNNITSVVYDASNRVSQVKDPLNLAITLSYGSNGLSSIADPGGRATNVTVNSSKLLTAIQDPDGVGAMFAYDGSLRLQAITNRRGHTSTLAYHGPSNQLDSVIGPLVDVLDSDGIVRTAAPVTRLEPWQRRGVPYGGTSTPLAPPRADTVYARVTEPGGAVTRFTVNRWGTPVQTTDALGRVTTVTFDPAGLPLHVAHPSGGVDSATYNASGLPLRVRPAGASPTNLTYTHWAIADSVWTSGRPGVRTFVTEGRVDSVRVGGTSTSAGRVTRFEYDGRGRVIKTTDPEGHLLARTWFTGVNENRGKDSIPGGRVTTYGYDGLGRGVAVRTPGFAAESVAYDVFNRRTAVYDGVNPSPTMLGYDSLLLRTVTDPKGQVYELRHNALGQVVQQIDPLGRAGLRWYDRAGDLTRTRNRRGQDVNYAYDPIHRPVKKWGNSTTSDSLAYGPNDLTVTATNAASTVTSYLSVRGPRDSAHTALNGWTFTHRYTYDSIAGWLTQVAAEGNGNTFVTRTYVYDAGLGALKDIKLGTQTTSLTRNKDLQPTTLTLPGGDAVALAFTTTHRDYAISSTASYGQAIWRGLEYDKANRIYRYNYYPDATNLQRRMQFTYDSLGHLIRDSLFQREGDPCQADADAGLRCGLPEEWQLVTSKVFSYDEVGNRTDLGGDYGLGNRILAFNVCTYETDLDGNVTKRTCGSGVTDFWWSAENRLDSLQHGAQKTRFSYDATGRLVKKDGPEGTRYFLWDGHNLFAELDQTGAKLSELSYYGLDALHAIVLGATPYFAHSDGAGNVIALTDANQAVKRAYSYELYEWGGGGAAPDALFNGLDRARWKGALYLASDADLYYMRARWYEPKTGRFLSEDPIGLAGGINPYSFAGNDPINGRDPTGTCDKGEELWAIFYDNDRSGDLSPGDTVIGYYCKGGGGGGGAPGPGQQQQHVPPDQCPPIPQAPPNADINANIGVAEAHREYAVDWFATMVDYEKPWDYKTQGDQYQAFGNFNYGATGRAASIGPGVLYRAAGFAHLRHRGVSQWNAFKTAFLGDYPYGDDPVDQANIRAGQQYYQNNCHDGATP